jgi:alpha-1,2-rhamnosyltransferase
MARQAFRPVGSLPSIGHVPSAPAAAAAVSAGPAVMPLPSGLSVSKRMLKDGIRQTLTTLRLIDTARNARRAVRSRINQARLLMSADPDLGVRPGRRDLLLSTDTIWDTPEIYDGFHESVSRGAMLGAIVYDLIPLRFPELYGAHLAKIFHEWFLKVTYYGEFLMCISESVWEDVQEYMQEHNIRNRRGEKLRGGFFHLGAGLDAPSDPHNVRPDIVAIFPNQPADNPYVMVNWLDPRKDLVTAVRAFEQLWAGGSQAKLVAIGRPYTGTSPLERLVFEHPEYGKRLFCLQNVEDAELDFCYRNSASLITASYAEGFNLPIIESLQRGRPVLAADIPVHREVAGAFAHYFPCRQPEKLADLISRQQAGKIANGLAPVRNFRWPDWSMCCQDLYEKIVDLYAAGAA